MTRCDFEQIAEGLIRCKVCETERETTEKPERYHCRCTAAPAAPTDGLRGLGDVVANGLALLGIEKQPGCGCGARQAWLNRVFPF